jgi:site-specific DNA-methyltransferase (adenine-specific)
MLVENQTHVPDILDCIANLSSDEVFTPPDVANQVLDLLPKEIWSNPDIKILDPCTKTGIFLRESARRLMVGLEEKIPNEIERREHIFKNMLFGIAITELTGLLARRSLYYSKDAKNDYSIVQFKDSDGNIQFKRMEHEYVQGKCKVCGSPYENLERGSTMENYAYQFIHEKDVSHMKFDVVVGNPPYQIADGGGGKGTSASPLYHLFVNQAFRLKPRYVAMIIPSRWFSGGKGLDSFREQMLNSTNFRSLVDYTNALEVFPGTQIKGGVCYFLWDKNYTGPCEVTQIEEGSPSESTRRYLNEHGDVFIRFNEATPILDKVKEKATSFHDEFVSSRKPFGILSNFKDYKEKEFKGSIQLYGVDGIKWIDRKYVTTNKEWIGLWKTLIPKAGPGNDGYPHRILGVPLVAPPGSCATETYLVAGVFESQVEAENLAKYLKTKFARFMIALVKNTQNLTKSGFRFLPVLDYSNTWTDKTLFKYFEISEKESEFIDSIVKPMD